MPDIVLTTLNAKYIHCAFGLRYLLANLGELRPRAGLAEFDINQFNQFPAELCFTLVWVAFRARAARLLVSFRKFLSDFTAEP